MGSMAGRPVLIFGFEPFLKFRENPSEKVAKTLNSKFIGGRKVIGRVLPVDYDRVEKRIVSEIERHRPAVVIGTGLAAGRPVLSIEKIALNYEYSEEPDNKGRKARGTPIDPASPDGMFSNIGPERLAAKLNKMGIPATVSLSAGAYLCNFAMFIIVRESVKRGFKGGFVHLPLDEQMATKEEHRHSPFMSLDSMVSGISAIASDLLKAR